MTAFLLAAAVLLAGLVPCGFVLLRGSATEALVALELAGTLAVLALLLLSEGFGRPAYFVLPLLLAPLSVVGALVFTHFLAARE